MLDKKISALVKAFSSIGRSNGTAPPESDSNTHGVAYELVVADRLRKLADARWEAAKEHAVEVGVLPTEVKVGDNIVYNKDGIVISIKRNNDSTTLDPGLLLINMQKVMTAIKAQGIVDSSKKPRKGQTIISAGVS